jgi:hypothetical protein
MPCWGVFSIDNLEDLTYKTNGEPLWVEPTTTWSYNKKRTWDNYRYGDDPYYQEELDREYEAHLEQVEMEEIKMKQTQQEQLGAVDKALPMLHTADNLVEQIVLELPDEDLP